MQDSPFIQSAFNPRYKFYVEYAENRRLYGIFDVPFEAASELLQSYLNKEDWWKTAVRWELSGDLNTGESNDITRNRFQGWLTMPRPRPVAMRGDHAAHKTA